MYNPQALQENLLVSFFNKSVKMNRESEEKGVPIFKEILYIKKVVPFKDKDSIEKKASPEEIAKYTAQYQAFQNREKYEEEGVLIKNWNYASESEVQMLLAHKVVTVEQVAALDDVAVKRMGNGGRALRNAARKYAEQSQDVDVLKDKIKELEAIIKELQEVKNDTPNRNTKRSKRNRAISATS